MKKSNPPIVFMFSFCKLGSFSFFLFCFTFMSAQSAQNINFPDIPIKGYGDTTFVLNATSSSGAVTYTSSNTAVATINGNVVTIKSVGYSYISAFEMGIGTNAAAAPVSQLLVVCPKATLTVQADDKIIALGSNSPTMTYTISGYKRNETVAVVTGTPEFTPLSNINFTGTYPIVINRNNLSATNYEFMMEDGILTVNPTLAAPFSTTEIAEMKIYFNTRSNFISLTNADKVAISFIDMSGKTVLQTTCNGDLFTVDISGLSSGIYVLQSVKNSETQNTKFIVSK